MGNLLSYKDKQELLERTSQHLAKLLMKDLKDWTSYTHGEHGLADRVIAAVGAAGGESLVHALQGAHRAAWSAKMEEEIVAAAAAALIQGRRRK
jgi:hypothetical protein